MTTYFSILNLCVLVAVLICIYIYIAVLCFFDAAFLVEVELWIPQSHEDFPHFQHCQDLGQKHPPLKWMVSTTIMCLGHSERSSLSPQKTKGIFFSS